MSWFVQKPSASVSKTQKRSKRRTSSETEQEACAEDGNGRVDNEDLKRVFTILKLLIACLIVVCGYLLSELIYYLAQESEERSAAVAECQDTELEQTKASGVSPQLRPLPDEGTEEVRLFPTMRPALSSFVQGQLRRSPWMVQYYSWFCLFVFVLLGFCFLLYDTLMERRVGVLTEKAVQSTAIVDSLFPAVIRDRLFASTSSKAQSSSSDHHHHSSSSVQPPLSVQHLSSSSVISSMGVASSSGVTSWHHQERESTSSSASTSLVANTATAAGTATSGHKWSTQTSKLSLGRLFGGSGHGRRHSPTDLESVDSCESFANEQGGPSSSTDVIEAPPIAEFFPSTTIMFADIAGFTAWSSQREPQQVFKLLETLYRDFDEVANKLGVFKVETVGDCYIGASGVPTSAANHAMIMARFSRECLAHMDELLLELEAALGPGTTDLALRIGLHSGPVTGGVLRGDKSRFQLFGDSMNTAARMESTGIPGRIQVSQETARLVVASGQQHLLSPRPEFVEAKGKGKMQTYWLRPKRSTRKSNDKRMRLSATRNQRSFSSLTSVGTTASASANVPSSPRFLGRSTSVGGGGGTSDNWGSISEIESSGCVSDSKEDRLVGWNTDILYSFLKKIVAHRRKYDHDDSATSCSEVTMLSSDSESTALAEVSDTVTLNPDRKFRRSLRQRRESEDEYLNCDDAVRIDPKIKAQLHDYVGHIAFMYNDNQFHNLEHASHVTMSANKLMNRIIDVKKTRREGHHHPHQQHDVASSKHQHLHEASLGLSSDPLAQFAIVFSALIHDCEHMGVPNAQLIRERSKMAARYNDRSVAECNSIDVAWGLLMEPRYIGLRETMFGKDCGEMKRFRQLVVNCVIATDISDKELAANRKKRWAQAFSSSSSSKRHLHPTMSEESPTSVTSSSSNNDDDDDEEEGMNRKAAIVIEHIMQASDVAHTMQHWHVFCKWNERLFNEMKDAYEAGRATVDPSVPEFWFKDQISFFDHYVIPLARNLKECGVFGVSSDEYLNYALDNRKEWELKGRDVSKNFVLERELRLKREEVHERRGGGRYQLMSSSVPFLSKATESSPMRLPREVREEDLTQPSIPAA